MRLLWLLLTLCISLTPIRTWASSTTFDALDTLYTIPSSASTTATTFTTCSWLYRTGNGEGGLGIILAKGTGSPSVEWRLYNWGSASNTYILEVVQPATIDGEWRMLAAARPANDVWHHFCVTYDGTSTGNDPLMYVNGASVSVTKITNPSPAYSSSATVMMIGGNVAAGNTWQGRMANVGYWNRVLSDNEIRSVFYHGVRANARGLIGYWPLGVHGGANLTATAGLGATEALGVGSKNGDGPPTSHSQGGARE